jgi:hypothetical protein
MSTDAQIAANQANSQHSTGPITDEGKAVSSQNNFKYGLTGHSFAVLEFENQDEYDHVLSGLRFEHQPATMTESILVEKMAQSYWLSKRALYLQDQCATDEDLTLEQQQKQLALFLRYQTTHDRAFRCALHDLLKLRAERTRAEIGFESQKARAADETHKQEAHEARTRLAHAKAAHLELDTEIRSTIEARIPGDIEIPFDRLKDVLRVSLQEVARDMASKKAA